MTNQFSRTELLLGKEGVQKLASSRIIVFGIGGVGGYVVEALVRSGVKNIDIVDNDKVSLTNLNRQIIATQSTLGKYKVDVMEARIKDINPETNVIKHNLFYTPVVSSEIDFTQYDYVVDAIDTVSGKLSIIEQCKKNNVPVISSMGAGNKTHPEMFEIADISKTSVCPLAKVIRQELKKRKISKVKVVYSKEIPQKSNFISDEKLPSGKKQIPGSCAYVPSVVGFIIASVVIRDIIEK